MRFKIVFEQEVPHGYYCKYVYQDGIWNLIKALWSIRQRGATILRIERV